MIPVLETERLILRGSGLGRFSATHAIWADPRTTHQFGSYTYDEELVWLRFLRISGNGHYWVTAPGAWKTGRAGVTSACWGSSTPAVP